MAQFYANRLALGSHRAKTQEGYLVILGTPIARTGVQKYKASELKLDSLPGDKNVEVFRPYSEVFSAPTIASFEGKSVTSPHPPVFLTPDNDANYSRGHAQNIRAGEKLPDGEYGLLADLVIKDNVLINRLDNDTIAEISCGYDYDLEPDPMEPDRWRQVNIRGNHIAIVESGRAGSSVRVLDASPEAPQTERKEVDMEGEVKQSTGFFTEMKNFLSSFGLRLATNDTSPDDPVKRNEDYNAEALRRAVRRNEDATVKTLDADPAEKELEKEEKGAKDPEKSEEKGTHDKKHAKDDDDDKKAKDDDKKHASDAVDRLADLLVTAISGKLSATDKKRKNDDDEEKCNCGAKGEEAHDDDCPMASHRAADDELIPVETLAESERPHNPIPGADQKKALDALNALKPFIAASGDRRAIDEWNAQYKAIRGKGNSRGSYDAVLHAREKDREGMAQQDRLRTGDAQHDAGKKLVEQADRYLGRDVAEVNSKKEVVN